MEELIPKVTEALDIRLKEMKEQLLQIKEDMKLQHDANINQFTASTTTIAGMLSEIARKTG